MPLKFLLEPLASWTHGLTEGFFERQTQTPKASHSQGFPVDPNISDTLTNGTHVTPNIFNNAHDFVIKSPTMIENTLILGKTALELLHQYSTPDAAMDASARDPPPRCHPETRRWVGEKLEKWLDDDDREWNMIWLHGFVGTGKSAVAQTFAEFCSLRNRLGAAFFFSRSNNRDSPERVIPTIVYQLSVHCPAYKSLITQSLSDNPQLLEKSISVQFQRLIVDPLSLLQARGDESIRQPFLVILDGLDECSGENAQRTFIGLISGLVQSRKRFPILWLICSRPEPHITHSFSKVSEYKQVVLMVDAESRHDVEIYLRTEFAGLREEYQDIIPPSWPSNEQFNDLLHFCSGLFIAASVSLKYVRHSQLGNPMKGLDQLMLYLNGPKNLAQTSSDPLAALDLLYTQILCEVPDDVLTTILRIFSYIYYLSKSFAGIPSCQVLCNLLRLDQATFYTALRQLHSVLLIPAPKDAMESRIHFHHTSFRDFLIDRSRSKRFAIRTHRLDLAKTLLYWHQLDSRLFHTDDGIKFDHNHQHGCLPNLTWASKDTEHRISMGIARIADTCAWAFFNNLSKDANLLSHVYNADLRYANMRFSFCNLPNWVHSQDPSSAFWRTEPSTDIDYQLLDYLTTITRGAPAKPVIRPLLSHSVQLQPGLIEYFFFGQGVKTILVWVTETNEQRRIYKLSADQPPTEKDITCYQNWFFA